MSDAVLELGAVPAPPRRRELLFGTAFASAGVVMVLVTLIGAYLNARSAAPVGTWLAKNTVPLTQPNMMMATLAMSAVTMQWAVWSIDRDDRGHTYMALGVTLLFGAAYLNQASFLFGQIEMTMGQLEGPLFYATTGTHVAMVIGAMIFVVLMGFRALGGQFSSRQPDGIGAAAVFWHATVASFALVWVAVYILK
jgi:heme/copper-type cytochrome/quinol oxidase subunit 3